MPQATRVGVTPGENFIAVVFNRYRGTGAIDATEALRLAYTHLLFFRFKLRETSQMNASANCL